MDVEIQIPVVEHSWRSPNEIDHMNRLDDECFASTYAYQPKVSKQTFKDKNERSSKTLSPYQTLSASNATEATSQRDQHARVARTHA